MKSLFLHKKHLSLKAVLAGLLSFIILVVSLLAFGFYSFVKELPTKEQTPILEETKFDGVVVFTGGKYRLGTTALIIKSGFKGPVFISGVSPRTDIKQTFLELNLTNNDVKQINFDFSAVSTASNVQQALNWVEANNLSHVLIITSFYHIPRTKLLLKKQGTKNSNFVFYPVFSNNVKVGLLFSEYIKYLLFNFNTVITFSLGSQLPY
ncbi:MAG: YdcF family protein [Proteobacteria bacterium]|nr:YdcF family protein [Pseudomonadota bacterium]